MPSTFPPLKRLKFRGQSCGDEGFHCLGLAEVIRLSPSFEALNNGSHGLLPLGRRSLLLLNQKTRERCDHQRTRGRTRYLPLLKRGEGDGQAGFDKNAHSFRLAEIVKYTPCLQPCHDGVRWLSRHQAI